VSADNIINTQIQYKLLEEIESLKRVVISQGDGPGTSDLALQNNRLKEKVKKKSLELKIRNSDLKVARQGKYEVEKNLVSLNKCFAGFSNNYAENIKKLVTFIKNCTRSSSATYLCGHKFPTKKSELFYELCRGVLEASKEDYVVIENFKKSTIYQENTKAFSRNINALILCKISKGQGEFSILAVTFDKKISDYADFELIFSLVAKFLVIEEDRKNSHEDLISLYKEMSVLNRKVSVISSYYNSDNSSNSEAQKSLLKLLSTFSNSLISFIYVRKDRNKFDRVAQTCSSESVKELEEQIIFKLQMLRITQGSKKRFYIKFTKEDMQDEIIKKYKISSATSVPIVKNKKHLGNLVLLHQNNTTPSSGDLEYYDLVCLAATKVLD